MIEPVQSIQSRIKEIYERVGEINEKVGSVYSTFYVNPSEKVYNSNSTVQGVSSPKDSKTFQEILSEVMESQKSEGANKSSINIVSKPDESLRDIILNNEGKGEVSKDGEMSKKLDGIIEEASRSYAVPKELIKAIIKAESNFDPYAISPKNAMGLMQLIPSTAQEMGVQDVFDPYQNIMGGTKYLKSLLDKYNNNLFLALASYNAGPSKVDKSGGIPEIDETKDYVERVIKYYKEYSQKVTE